MRTLVWSPAFTRGLRRIIRRDPRLLARAKDTLRVLAEEPFHPSLHSHKLKGNLAGVWACTIDFSYRILFELVESPETGEEEIHLLAIGTHDEVY